MSEWKPIGTIFDCKDGYVVCQSKTSVTIGMKQGNNIQMAGPPADEFVSYYWVPLPPPIPEKIYTTLEPEPETETESDKEQKGELQDAKQAS